MKWHQKDEIDDKDTLITLIYIADVHWSIIQFITSFLGIWVEVKGQLIGLASVGIRNKEN